MNTKTEYKEIKERLMPDCAGNVVSDNDLEREFAFLKDCIATAYGIAILEFYDKTYLTGDNASRGKEKIQLLNTALKKLDEITVKLNLV